MNVQTSMIAFGKSPAPVRFQGTDEEGRYVKEVVVSMQSPFGEMPMNIGEARPPREWWQVVPDVVEGFRGSVEETLAAARKVPEYFKPGAEKMLKAASEVIGDQIAGAKELFAKLKGDAELTPEEEHRAVGILEAGFDRLSATTKELEPMHELHDRVCGTGQPEDEQVHAFVRELNEAKGNQKLGEAMGRHQAIWTPVAQGIVQQWQAEQEAQQAQQAQMDADAQDLPPALRAQLGLGDGPGLIIEGTAVEDNGQDPDGESGK